MAVSQPPGVYQTSLPMPSRKHSQRSMSLSKHSFKWIDEDLYKTTVLSLYPSMNESEEDEKLEASARDLGLLPVKKTPELDAISSSLSATTISSENQRGSIMSQSTAPTSCASSDRRPSTSLSNSSSKLEPKFELPSIVTELDRKRNSGFKSGFLKMAGFRKKKSQGSNTPSMISIRSHMTGTATTDSYPSPPKGPASVKSGNSYSSHESPVPAQIFAQEALVDEQALQRSLECEDIVRIRTQQLEEKRKFLEYQTRLIQQLLAERDAKKVEKRQKHEKGVAEREEKNDKATEDLEARQLEDELKQQIEHETERRAIETRLKHMEAYCQTPSLPNSPMQPIHTLRASEDSMNSLPERHITQQHYENLAQVYHMRDNMDSLHASKINVLRGKQKKALQNLISKQERESDRMERDHQKELDSTDLEYGKQMTEIRQEFELKRTKLEARWKLQALIERTKKETSTGMKYEGLPDVVAIEP